MISYRKYSMLIIMPQSHSVKCCCGTISRQTELITSSYKQCDVIKKYIISHRTAA